MVCHGGRHQALVPGEDSMTIAFLQPTIGLIFIGVWVLVAHILVGDRRKI
jgi:hypothetical protein